jgi:hypothetical protein
MLKYEKFLNKCESITLVEHFAAIMNVQKA